MDALGSGGMGWGQGKRAEKWPLSQGGRTWLQTGKRIKPGDLFFLNLPPLPF